MYQNQALPTGYTDSERQLWEITRDFSRSQGLGFIIEKQNTMELLHYGYRLYSELLEGPLAMALAMCPDARKNQWETSVKGLMSVLRGKCLYLLTSIEAAKHPCCRPWEYGHNHAVIISSGTVVFNPDVPGLTSVQTQKASRLAARTTMTQPPRTRVLQMRPVQTNLSKDSPRV